MKIGALLGTVSGGVFEGLAGASVVAEVRKPNDATTVLDLFDDGLHDDGTVNDGQYANTFVETSLAGECRMTLRAEGTTPESFQFKRIADETFTVGAEIERVVEVMDDELLDSDADGVADHLKVGCLVTLGTAGDYSIAGDIESVQTGAKVSASVLAEGVPEGETKINLFFDLREHDGTGNRLGGSLSLTNLGLYSEGDSGRWLSSYEGTYATSERYMLISQAAGDGTISRDPDEIFYAPGTPVSVLASANPHSHFTGWTGDVPPGEESNPSIAVILDANKNLTAHFGIDQHTLVVNTVNGSVQRNPDQASYDYGSTVSLTAMPDTGHYFLGWTGDVPTGHESDNPLSITMDADKTVLATFVRSTGTVVISVTPDTGMWILTDGDGMVLPLGTGDATLTGIPTGQIVLAWQPLSGYHSPADPAPQELTKDGTIEFTGIYFIPPEASFSALQTSLTPPLTVEFTDESLPGTAPIESWSWTFGDGGTSNEQSPAHEYATWGNYSVSLSVMAAFGSNTATLGVDVEAFPMPAFAVAPAVGTVPLDVHFTDLTAAGSKPITDWAWDFGDGQSSDQQNPIHTYSDPGTYPILLRVTSAIGSAVSTQATTVETADSVVFTENPQDSMHYAGENARFLCAATGGRGVLHYGWKFDNGHKAISDVGTDSPQLLLTSVGLTSSGGYFCEVRDELGLRYTSNTATLSVAESLALSKPLPPQTPAHFGDSVTLEIEATGGFPPLLYQWYRDASKTLTPIGTDSPELTLVDLSAGDAGPYSVQISDANTATLQSSTVLVVEPGMPVAGAVGLTVLMATLGAAGFTLCRRK